MEDQNKLILTQADFQQLTSLIKSANPETAELLEEELSRASVVANGELPEDVVCMNSQVRFEDLETGKESMITLVYPHDVNIGENKISVLAPVGLALIGLRVGQVIKWPVPNRKEKRFKVLSVIAPTESE